LLSGIAGSNTAEGMIVFSCECCVLSGRGVCDELITRPEESYRLWRIVLLGLESSRRRWPWPALRCGTTEEKNMVDDIDNNGNNNNNNSNNTHKMKIHSVT
jgi:hypothetical protein